MDHQSELDTTGLLCPEPVMMLHAEVRKVASKDIISNCALSTDYLLPDSGPDLSSAAKHAPFQSSEQPIPRHLAVKIRAFVLCRRPAKHGER